MPLTPGTTIKTASTESPLLVKAPFLPADSPAFRLRRAVLIVTGLATLIVSTACKREHTPAPISAQAAVKIRTVTVSGEARTGTEEAVGTVRARLRASVEAKVAGRIQELLVSPGQLVHKGDPVAVLDGREIRARLDSAQAVLEQATKDYNRTAKLNLDGAATAAEVDAVRARQRVAAAGVAEAEAMLEHTRVIAPFEGVITRKLADVGDLATPGRPLVEIEDPTQLRFEADLPEALVDGIKLGSTLSIRLSSSPELLKGVVSEIAPMAESASRTYLVKLSLPQSTSIRAGQFGRVGVPIGEIRVPHLPAATLVQRGQLEFVFVIDSGKAQLRLVRSGKRFDDQIEIISGLIPGEKVAADKLAELRDGQPVELVP